MKLVFLFCSIGLFLYMSLSAAHPELKPYAEASEGMVRYVIELPKLEDESLKKVELVVGKTVPTDGVNRHFFGGKITRETIQGWGYSYYELKAIGPMAGTLMAPHPDAPKVNTFVPVRSDLGLLRYNSKLPLVVYVPEGVEVKYRLWSTPAEPIAAAVD
ncbi:MULTISPECIES: ecotin [unclassified Lentimonas]|uniref:ecotin n=1 Tax=unclassified Lentimonas TaxID=2630993 RepID=UPI00132638D1|nr:MULTISPECIES: ecotin family protein [unclassified Lentimonas]CAA6676569.1 Proteinase inhibitor I11, ecotin precursor [Lentimonas sp. CC4]CAA6684767.1 Proteinase inhibitor I11, ecotin precursor [Lentimonas sp. CC6]CAA6692049.1 Proteinase inhibitor I11, ecotin precursor [Lentimonas sp. CC10]CAA6694010.1 Proteinase inhibitor I11, ecotin precursor [Lentimonas sp. CC19]CAA7070266.1 Proteinase inhibitor I11, ecotin precursor [Lentimonas sp. CC11]